MPAWDTIEISEQGEDEQVIKSKIRVPQHLSLPGLYLILYFFNKLLDYINFHIWSEFDIKFLLFFHNLSLAKNVVYDSVIEITVIRLVNWEIVLNFLHSLFRGLVRTGAQHPKNFKILYNGIHPKLSLWIEISNVLPVHNWLLNFEWKLNNKEFLI